jgi:protein SCO1/2
MEDSMDKGRRTLSLLALNTVAIAGIAPSIVKGGAVAGGPHDTGQPSLPGTGTRAQMARYLPNVDFVTQHGRHVKFYDDLIKGRNVLINFMYTECLGTCPRSTSNLVKVQAALGSRVGRDIFMLSITLTPARDTPAVLEAYAGEHGCKDGWYFLTGSMNDVDRVRRNLGVYDNPDIRQHIGVLTYGNEPAARWGATSTLASADHIVWSVKSRIDPWVAQPWPSRT